MDSIECRAVRNVRSFLNKHVKIGNWAEELLLGEVNQSHMLSYLRRNETMTQKVNDVYRDYFKAITLPSDSNVTFGNMVQLRSPCLRALNGRRLTLAITLSEDDIELGPNMCPGTRLCATTLNAPCVRNAFQIIPVEPISSGESQVRGKDIFMLKSAAGLLVEAEPPRSGTPVHPHNKAILRLTDRPSKNCWWVAEYKRIRKETPKEKQPLRVQEEVIIRKATNGEALAVETDLVYSTFFGKEYSVTACNPNGRLDQVTPEILWEFVTAVVV